MTPSVQEAGGGTGQPQPTADRSGRYFLLFSVAHIAVWTLLPFLALPNASLDMIELTYTGREWQLGYPRHPPLAAWLAQAALTLTGGAVWGLYLLSQLAVVTCFWAAWRLGREMLAPRPALLAAMLLECCFYYNFETLEFNNNLALYPFWALAVLFFYRALRTGASGYWVATGAGVGLGVLAKYSMAMLVLPMIAFMVVSPVARRHWSRRGPYLALLTALLLLAPHLDWAVQHHFPGVEYALERTRSGGRPAASVVGALVFARDQVAALLPMLIVLIPLMGRRWRLRRLEAADRFKRDFLVAMGLGPFAAYLVSAVAFDLRLRNMYGSPLWTFTGVLILFSFVVWTDPVRWRWAASGGVVVAMAMVVAAVVYYVGAPSLYGVPLRTHFPGRELAARAETVWKEHYDRPLAVVGGEWWLAGNVALYHPLRPHVYGGLSPKVPDLSRRRSPWISDQALKREGGIILWSADRQGPAFAALLCGRFPTLEVLEPVTLRWKTRAPGRPVRVAMAIVPPGSDGASADSPAARLGRGCPIADPPQRPVASTPR